MGKPRFSVQSRQILGLVIRQPPLILIKFLPSGTHHLGMPYGLVDERRLFINDDCIECSRKRVVCSGNCSQIGYNVIDVSIDQIFIDSARLSQILRKLPSHLILREVHSLSYIPVDQLHPGIHISLRFQILPLRVRVLGLQNDAVAKALFGV